MSFYNQFNKQAASQDGLRDLRDDIEDAVMDLRTRYAVPEAALSFAIEDYLAPATGAAQLRLGICRNEGAGEPWLTMAPLEPDNFALYEVLTTVEDDEQVFSEHPLGFGSANDMLAGITQKIDEQYSNAREHLDYNTYRDTVAQDEIARLTRLYAIS